MDIDIVNNLNTETALCSLFSDGGRSAAEQLVSSAN